LARHESYVKRAGIVAFEAVEGRLIVMAGLGPTGAEIAVRHGVLPVMAWLGRAMNVKRLRYRVFMQI
jgi:hypothetical protein